MSIDFIYYPLVNDESGGMEKIPGMYACAAPRNANRHRRGDLLAIYVHLFDEHGYKSEEISALVRQAADQFFQTQGSVTRAMQTVCDQVNRQMLSSNIDRAYEGIHASGFINMVVLHKQWLFLGQYGTTTALKVATERFDVYGEMEDQGESLGQMKRIQARFYQCAVSPGDLIILCGRPPESWTAPNLAGSQLLGVAALKRRLLSLTPLGLSAVVIRCSEGSGQAMAGTWTEEIAPIEKKDLSEEITQLESQPAPVGSPITETQPHLAQTDQMPTAESMGEPETSIYQKGEMDSGEDAEISAQGEIPVLTGETEQAAALDRQAASKGGTQARNPLLMGLGRAWMNAKTGIAKFRLFWNKIQPGFLKNRPTGLHTAPPFLAVLVALILPVGLTLLSVSVYRRSGQIEQYEAYLSQAQEAFELAENETEPMRKHAYWEKTIELASRAEEFNVTRDSRLLLEQAQFLLDEMDLATRLEFRPALTSFLPEGVAISRVRSSYSGLYLLDETSGSIVRLSLNAKGFYDIDDGFKCSPGPYGLVNVTKLVDFITLPANDDNHKVAAIDGQGNLLYCRSDDPPVSNTLTPPQGGWGQITALAYDQDTLYVLDSLKSEIWMYAGKNPNKMNVPGVSGIFFVESPNRFLDEDIPDLKGGRDIAVNQDDVYVLHEDGHMTLCHYSPIKEVRLTECQDPAPYTDNRVGREDKKPWIFMDARFAMMQDLKVPTLSIFILDTQEPSVYQFSFQLNLERTLRIMPNNNFPLPASSPSGFGVTPDMEIILAYNNRLYLAPLR